MYTLEELRDKTFKQLKALGYQLNVLPDGDKRCRQNWIDAIAGVQFPLLALLEESAPADSDSSGAIEVQTSPGAIDVQRTEPIELAINNSPGVETSPGAIEFKFGRTVYPPAGSKSIAQLPKTFPGVEDIQGQNHAEPNGIGTEQNGTDEIAIGPDIHQQCLNTAQPDGGNDGAQTQTPRSQKGDRILATAGNGQAVKRRPLPCESTELTAIFSDDRPPNRGDNGRDRLESEPVLSQSAIEPVVGSSQECR